MAASHHATQTCPLQPSSSYCARQHKRWGLQLPIELDCSAAAPLASKPALIEALQYGLTSLSDNVRRVHILVGCCCSDYNCCCCCCR
jgi:hypothetical protein